MITTQFNGEAADIPTVLSQLSDKYIIAVRLSRWVDKDGNDLGGRIDVDTEDFPTSLIYKTDIQAADFIVSTQPINPDPEQALLDAIAETEKGEGNPKSMYIMLAGVTKYLKSKKNKLK